MQGKKAARALPSSWFYFLSTEWLRSFLSVWPFAYSREAVAG
jgi:hypothetical protein